MTHPRGRPTRTRTTDRITSATVLERRTRKERTDGTGSAEQVRAAVVDRPFAEYLAMSPQTLYGWRCRKYGPPTYRLGNKVRYRPDEVRAWGGRARSGLVRSLSWDADRCRSDRGD
jgi:predicted DNA-binding transcriptional regulator AlpA